MRQTERLTVDAVVPDAESTGLREEGQAVGVDADRDRVKDQAGSRRDHRNGRVVAVRSPEEPAIGGNLKHVGTSADLPRPRDASRREPDDRDRAREAVADVEIAPVAAHAEPVGTRAGGDEPDLSHPPWIHERDATPNLVCHIEEGSVRRDLDIDRTSAHMQRPHDAPPSDVHLRDLTGELGAEDQVVPGTGEIEVIRARPRDRDAAAWPPGPWVEEEQRPEAFGDVDGERSIGCEVQVVRVGIEMVRVFRPVRGSITVRVLLYVLPTYRCRRFQDGVTC